MSAAVPTAFTCPYCLAAIDAGSETTACPSCRAVYHAECWEENGGCAVYGCAQVPPTEGRRALELPPSYWGRESKPCPACGQEILAAALRCRHCGATFASARPEDVEEFQTRTKISESLPGIRRTVVWIFVFSVVPFLSPIGAVWGAFWRASNRDSVRALPSLHRALARIGFIISVAFTAAVAVLTMLYVLVRSR